MYFQVPQLFPRQRLCFSHVEEEKTSGQMAPGRKCVVNSVPYQMPAWRLEHLTNSVDGTKKPCTDEVNGVIGHTASLPVSGCTNSRPQSFLMQSIHQGGHRVQQTVSRSRFDLPSGTTAYLWIIVCTVAQELVARSKSILLAARFNEPMTPVVTRYA